MARRLDEEARWNRFWPKVASGHFLECWPWQGSVKNGYGRFFFAYRERYAHREAYELFEGATVPDGMVVMHICNNKACCNPDHLRLGTTSENTRDAYRDGLAPSGARHPKAKYDDDFIARVAADPRPQLVISADLGISQSHVSRIKTGQHRRRAHA